MKPQIRLPSDPGPNPYDSSTSLSELPQNKWLVSVGWWFAIATLGVGFALARWSNGTLG